MELGLLLRACMTEEQKKFLQTSKAVCRMKVCFTSNYIAYIESRIRHAVSTCRLVSSLTTLEKNHRARVRASTNRHTHLLLVIRNRGTTTTPKKIVANYFGETARRTALHYVTEFAARPPDCNPYSSAGGTCGFHEMPVAATRHGSNTPPSNCKFLVGNRPAAAAVLSGT